MRASMSAPVPHPARATSRLAACVLALFALGWLLDRAHVAFEAHHYCAEHGRVEHGGAFDPSGAQPTRGPSVQAQPSSAHETCCLALARTSEPLALVHPPLDGLVWPPSAGDVVDTHAREAARSTVPLVLLAPKQSPPRG